MPSVSLVTQADGTDLAQTLMSFLPLVDRALVITTRNDRELRDAPMDDRVDSLSLPPGDDASALRNQALERTRTDWVLWVDAGDRISEADARVLRSVLDNDHSSRIEGFILTVLTLESGRTILSDEIRLFRNRPTYRFEGRINTTIYPSIRRAQGGMAWADATIHARVDSASSDLATIEHNLRLAILDLADNPRCPRRLFQVGAILHNAERSDDAIAHLCRAVQSAEGLEPWVPRAYTLLVDAYEALGRSATAVEVCDCGLARYPGDVELTYRKALLALKRGELVLAERLFLQVLRPQSHVRFRHYDVALAGYEAWLRLALIYEKLAEYDDAAQTLWRAVHEQPSMTDAWLRLIDAQARGTAIDALQSTRALAIRMGRTDVVLAVDAAELAGNGAPIGACSALERAVAESGDQAPLMRRLCRLAVDHGPPPYAHRWLSQLIELCPGDAVACEDLALVCLRQGLAEEARQWSDRAIETRPNSERAHAIRERAAAALVHGERAPRTEREA